MCNVRLVAAAALLAILTGSDRAFAQCQVNKLTAGEIVALDEFGGRVAIDGNTAVAVTKDYGLAAPDRATQPQIVTPDILWDYDE